MSSENNSLHKSFFGRRLYIYLAILVSISIWLMIHGYVHSIGVHEDEAAATAATAFFLAGVFAGRYIAQLWTIRKRNVQNQVTTVMVVLIITCTSWLFFHADFPLQNRPAINLLLFWLPFVIISLALGILVKVVRSFTQAQLDEARAVAAHNKSELGLLQSQLSPHFLFNTLNNLYGLSISQHEKVPPLLLKLADLLRYAVYDTNAIFVPVKDEIAYLNNYIDFEKIRLGDRLQLTSAFEEMSHSAIKIAPMLLVVFIENAFKYSKNAGGEKIYIDIELKTWGQSILFSVKNSQEKRNDFQTKIDKHSGFGLASVNKRLELLYPGEHRLTIQDEPGFYHVLLQLQMR